MKTVIFCWAAWLFSSYSLSQNQSSARTAQIRITNTNSSKDSFVLTYWPQLFDVLGYTTQPKIRQQQTGSTAVFSVHIPKDQQGVYANISHNNQYLSPAFWLIETGDSVDILVDNNKPVFSGRGSAKYQFLYYLDSLSRNWKGMKDSLPVTLPAGTPMQYRYPVSIFNGIMKWNSKIQLAGEALKKIENQLSPWAYQVLQAEIVGTSQRAGMYAISNYTTNFPDTFPKKAKDSLIGAMIHLYKQYRSSTAHIDSNALAFSLYYNAWLVDEAMKAPILYQTTGLNWVLHHFKGIIKDRLLTAVLLRTYERTEPEQIRAIGDQIQEPRYRAVAETYISHQTIGEKIFPFRLTSSEGKILTAADFRGKVLLMDFWFTGCSGCVAIAPNLNRIQQALAADSSFVFLSVSFDKDASTWKKSIQKGLYTGKDFLHTYTNGNASDDPLLQYYSIHAAPTVFIFDNKGGFYSSRLPRFTGTETLESYLSHLKGALR